MNFQRNGVVWPINNKKPNRIRVSKETEKCLWINKGYYVVTKRFSSKEEKKRIVANVYDSSLSSNFVGFENHLNVFHKKKKGLSSNLALGLSAYLNSSLLDRYFRLFSGHTQVNSADLRAIHYPSIEALERIGRHLQDNPNPEQQTIDSLINKEIEEMPNDMSIDPMMAQHKIDEALEILKALGLPRGQHNERSALTLLAILNMRPETGWEALQKPLIGITPIMDWCQKFYGKTYAPNTRETFRRQTMHQFVDAGIAIYNPDEPNRPVNSPKACYQVSPEAFDIISTFGSGSWKKTLTTFLKQKETLSQRYAMAREMKMIPVEVAKNKEIKLTPGKHSKLIRDIIIDFMPLNNPQQLDYNRINSIC